MARRFANKDDLIVALFAEKFAYWERQARQAAESEDVWVGFARYFEESAEALVQDRGFRELVGGAYTAPDGRAAQARISFMRCSPRPKPRCASITSA